MHRRYLWSQQQINLDFCDCSKLRQALAACLCRLYYAQYVSLSSLLHSYFVATSRYAIEPAYRTSTLYCCCAYGAVICPSVTNGVLPTFVDGLQYEPTFTHTNGINTASSSAQYQSPSTLHHGFRETEFPDCTAVCKFAGRTC